MNIFVNGKPVKAPDNTTLANFKETYYPDSDVQIVNAAVCDDPERRINDGDRLYLIKRGEVPTKEILAELQFSRQPFAVTSLLQKACVGIAGAGGLGTVVAEILARAGIGKLVIADFDVVEPSNLNRQRFLLSQLGRPKVEALADNIKAFTPFIDLVTLKQKVTAADCATFFSGCTVVAECFDRPENKAEIVFGLKKNLPGCSVVTVSGIAGLADGNDIRVRKISEGFWVVGDMTSDAGDGGGLLASRVGIAASLQAHLIIRLLAGEQT